MALQEKDVAAASAHDGLVVTPQGATKVRFQKASPISERRIPPCS